MCFNIQIYTYEYIVHLINVSHMFILASTQLEEWEWKFWLITFQLRIVVLKKSSSLNNAQFVNTQFYLIVLLVISHGRETLRDCRIYHPGDSETRIEDSGTLRFELCWGGGVADNFR